MKLFVILSLFGLVACGGDSAADKPSLGEVRSFDPIVVDGEDLLHVKEICSALSAKRARLYTMVSNEYQFQYAQKNCEDEALGSFKDITVILRKEFNSDYTFSPMRGGEAFPFTNPETGTSGLMGEICDRVDSLESPILLNDSESALWFKAFKGNDDCKEDDNSMCIFLQLGSHEEQHRYKVHTRELIKFQLVGPRQGFFVERVLESSSSCKGDQFIMRKAILK